MNPYLEVESGAEAKRYELEIGIDDVVIGRSTECDWVISAGAVSRRHARLRRQSGAVTIEDLGSSNGTFVNGVRLAEPTPLQDQDAVRFGTIEAHFFSPKPTPEMDATVSVAEMQAAMSNLKEQATIMAGPREAKAPPVPAQEVEAPVPEREAAPPPVPAPSGSAAAPAAASAARPSGSGTGSMPTRAADASSETAFRPAPRPREQPREAAASPAVAVQPSLLELAVIAAASFIVVFGLGALIVRFVF